MINVREQVSKSGMTRGNKLTKRRGGFSIYYTHKHDLQAVRASSSWHFRVRKKKNDSPVYTRKTR